MKIAKLPGWQRYSVTTEDYRVVAIVDLTPATTDDEKRKILDSLAALKFEEAADKNES